MGYFNLVILLSRYIFAGFGIIFMLVAFSFMRPFVNYNMGTTREKNRFLNLCITFVHLAGISILIGKQADETLRAPIAINGLVMYVIIILTLWLLKLWKRQHELVLWQIMFFMMDIGFIMLERLDHDLATKQLFAYVIGVVAALIFPSIFSILIKPGNKYIYLGILIVTMFLPFVAGTTMLGATNWVSIGGFSFQPSEIGKVALVLFLASMLSDGEKIKRGYKGLIFHGIVVIGALGCLVLQRDLGAALLYYLTALMMLFMATRSALLPCLGLLAGAVGSVGGYFAFSHVRVRVEAWLDPWADISGKGYQVVQGLFAMGTWGWLGSGLTRGVPNKIPLATSDYIFAAICEEFGNLMGIVILLGYLGIILLCIQVAFRYTHAFYRLIIVGIATIFAVQVFIIIGGVMKLIPLTGITSPFLSAGGTSAVVSMGMIGLITYFSYKGRVNDDEKGGN
ncbi:FtsW/RodA/SpoVE family cell cycle protein [Cellulosilyticum ruminicola]|uniref:FtsW/RodA/SpoVE family cell cycle protein n=1 Tax=Cellulosilyticum ruminicola TaxID=425254 RepID=UPI0006D2356C|nr:FtsW/RodA/SpoVE family cell cycle protein [Cellulosilyticum ruminicola]